MVRIGAGTYRPRWGDGDLVFTDSAGGPLEPRNWLRRYEDAVKRAGLEGVTIHTLRHSMATFLLRSGVHMKVVAELLGHASSSTTEAIYAHVTEATTRAAVVGLDGFIRRRAAE